jgi:HSP20 family protein
VARPRDIDRWKGDIDDLFAELWQVPRFSGLRKGFRPQVDSYLTDDPERLTIVVELAGVAPEDVRIVASGRTLLISGERRRPAEGARYQQMEIDYGSFRREIALTHDVDLGRAEATYQTGLLTIVFPIAERPPRPVRVPIEVRRRS